MPDESNLIPPSRFARWLLLGLLLVVGAVLYFRDGVRLPAFGSIRPTAADSTR
jgi:hypothetical protein